MSSYKEMGGFWDTHDLTDCSDKIEPAYFEVEIEDEQTIEQVEDPN